MSKFSDFLTGNKILEVIDSPINGEISVIKGLGYGTYVQVGGLTQCGGVVEDVWKRTIKKLKNLKTEEFGNCLILGLGAGTVAKLVRNNWSDTKITGIEIDQKMVDIGKKYFKLGKLGLEIKAMDAWEFLEEKIKDRRLKTENKKPKTKNQKPITEKYDLLLVDMYVGDQVPEKFETETFIKKVKKLLSPKGIAIFNRLYYGDKRKQARKFGELLEENFKQVIYHYPQANLMLICLN